MSSPLPPPHPDSLPRRGESICGSDRHPLDDLREGELVALGVHPDGVALGELALEEPEREPATVGAPAGGEEPESSSDEPDETPAES